MGVQGILVIFTVFAFVQGSSSSSCNALKELCFLHNNVEIPYIEIRHPDIKLSPETNAEKYCDLFALDPNIWYRSTYNMTTHVVQPQGCGTKYPIWLNGTIPGPTDGTVSRTACVRGLFEECELTYTVQIKNCKNYTVYCFPSVPDNCHQRYCFDTDRKSSTTPPTTRVRTTSAPRIYSTSYTTTTTSSKDCYKKCPDCSAQGFFDNSLAVFLVTLGTCTIVFGVTMVAMLYLIRRKVFSEAKYANQTKNSTNQVEMTVPEEQPYATMNRIDITVPEEQQYTQLDFPENK